MDAEAQDGNSELIIPPPQDQYRSKNKLNNQHKQHIAHCMDMAVHVWWAGYSAGLGIPRGYRQWTRTVRLPVVARTLAVAIEKPKSRGSRNPLPLRRIWCD